MINVFSINELMCVFWDLKKNPNNCKESGRKNNITLLLQVLCYSILIWIYLMITTQFQRQIYQKCMKINKYMELSWTASVSIMYFTYCTMFLRVELSNSIETDHILSFAHTLVSRWIPRLLMKCWHSHWSVSIHIFFLPGIHKLI